MRLKFFDKRPEERTVDDVLEYMDFANKGYTESDKIKYDLNKPLYHIRPMEDFFTPELIEQARKKSIQRQLDAVSDEIEGLIKLHAMLRLELFKAIGLRADRLGENQNNYE